MKTQVLSLAVFAGLAAASPVANTNFEPLNIQEPANTNTLTANLFNTDSWNEQGHPFNEVLSFGLVGTVPAVGFQITGISWDLNIRTDIGSYYSDANIRFYNTDETDSFTFAPGTGFDDGGTMNFVGSIDLVASGVDFATNADSILNIEFFESIDDAAELADATYVNGSTLTIHFKPIPAPGTLAMLGLGGLVAVPRRR